MPRLVVAEETQTPFQRALTAMGQTDKERAAILDVSRNTVLAWRKGWSAPKVANLIRHPELLSAYLESAKAAA